MRHRKLFIGITVGLILGICVICNGPYRVSSETYVMLETTGHLQVQFLAHVDESKSHPVSGRISREGDAGDRLRYWLPESVHPITATLMVERAGLTTITILLREVTEQSSRRIRIGSGGGEISLRKRALFIISAPAGTELTFPVSKDLDFEEVRLDVDYEADGIVDAELFPVVVASDSNLDRHRNQTVVEGRVRLSGDGGATVDFVRTNGAPESAGIYYAVYSSHPELRLYQQPFHVDEGDFIVYGAYSNTGWTQPTQELVVPGGTIQDIQVKASVDGGRVGVETIAPGQDAAITFNGGSGAQVEISVASAAGGIQPRDQATLDVIGPDGSTLIRQETLGTSGWASDLKLPLTGTYTILIDPHLTNVFSGLVTLTTLR